MNKRLEGGCQVPIACFATLDEDPLTAGGQIRLEGLVGRPDGSQILRAQGTAQVEQAEELGIRIAEDLLAQGAAEILAEVYAK